MLDFLYTPGTKKLVFVLFGVIFAILVAANLLVISLLAAASMALSYVIGWLKMRAVGIELVTFITVISALAYGTVPAALIGLALMAFHIIIGQYNGAYVVWVLPEYALAAVAASSLTGSAAFVGISVLLILHSINVMLTLAFSKEHFHKFLPYVITNVIFNIILFTQLGETVLGIIK